jgi:hypothetical protein
MTERHPDFFQILIREVGQNRKADVILGKALSVLPETELLKPEPAASRPPRLSGIAARIGKPTCLKRDAVDAGDPVPRGQHQESVGAGLR